MHFMKLHNAPFAAMKNRTKDIELRLYDEKRRTIKVGEYITFTNIDTEEQITVKCTALHKANSFKELFEKLNANERMGFKKGEISVEMAEQMREYYTEDKERKYGVLGIEFEFLFDLT